MVIVAFVSREGKGASLGRRFMPSRRETGFDGDSGEPGVPRFRKLMTAVQFGPPLGRSSFYVGLPNG